MRELVIEGCDQNECGTQNDQHASVTKPEYTGFSCHFSNFSLVRKIQEMVAKNTKFYSIEVFPQTNVHLEERVRSSLVGTCEPPLLYSVTWHVASPLVADPTEVPALRLASALAKQGPVLLHIAAEDLTESDVRRVLRHALLQGVLGLLLLRGVMSHVCRHVFRLLLPDGGDRDRRGSFLHAVDLVRFVRREFGQLFTVFVAGYPDGHPQAVSYQQDLLHLKEKVDAGADGIISQVVFEAERFASFVRDCASIGIRVPIIPGVMPIMSYRLLERASRICKFRIPSQITEALQPIREDEEAVKEYGRLNAIQLLRDLCSLGCTPGVHFFTMNRPELVTTIWQSQNSINAVPPALSPDITVCST